MTTAEQWRALAKRVEAATKKDPELDALILAGALAPDGATVEQSPINGAWCIYAGEDTRGRKRLWSPPHRYEGWALTESIDAIVALIEWEMPGVCWAMNGPPRAGALASGFIHWSDFEEDEPATGHAPTSALALCLAFCLAQAEVAAKKEEIADA